MSSTDLQVSMVQDVAHLMLPNSRYLKPNILNAQSSMMPVASIESEQCVTLMNNYVTLVVTGCCFCKSKEAWSSAVHSKMPCT